MTDRGEQEEGRGHRVEKHSGLGDSAWARERERESSLSQLARALSSLSLPSRSLSLSSRSLLAHALHGAAGGCELRPSRNGRGGGGWGRSGPLTGKEGGIFTGRKWRGGAERRGGKRWRACGGVCNRRDRGKGGARGPDCARRCVGRVGGWRVEACVARPLAAGRRRGAPPGCWVRTPGATRQRNAELSGEREQARKRTGMGNGGVECGTPHAGRHAPRGTRGQKERWEWWKGAERGPSPFVGTRDPLPRLGVPARSHGERLIVFESLRLVMFA